MSSAQQKLIDNSIKSFESDLWTSIPAEVTSISDNGDQTQISAKPVLNRLLRGLESRALPEIKEVPVMWPGSKQSLVRGSIAVGDWVLLVFSSRPLQNWLNSDGLTVDPESFQKHNYNSAVALPGIFPFSENVGLSSNQSLPDNQNDMVIKHNICTDNENEVRLLADGGVTVTASASGTVVTIAADGSMVIDASGGMTLNGDLQVNGTIDSTGDMTAGTISVQGHTHNYTDTNSGTGAGPGLGTVPTSAPI